MENLKSVRFYEIEVEKIQDLVDKQLDIEVEIIADEEKHNGYTPCHNMTAEDHTKDITDYINYKNQWAMGLHSWIEHLIFLNILPEGNYIVDHSW